MPHCNLVFHFKWIVFVYLHYRPSELRSHEASIATETAEPLIVALLLACVRAFTVWFHVEYGRK